MSDPKVKIIIPKDVEETDLNDFLYKATSIHVNGDTHLQESFDDPAMIDMSQKMIAAHDEIYKEMIAEIIQTLDEEYE